MYERALDVDPRNVRLWLGYTEMVRGVVWKKRTLSEPPFLMRGNQGTQVPQRSTRP